MEIQPQVASNDKIFKTVVKTEGTFSETSSTSSVSSNENSNENELAGTFKKTLSEYLTKAKDAINASHEDASKKSTTAIDNLIKEAQARNDAHVETLKKAINSNADEIKKIETQSEKTTLQLKETNAKNDAKLKKIIDELEATFKKENQEFTNKRFNAILTFATKNKILFSELGLEIKEVKGLDNLKSWHEIYGQDVVNKFFGIEKELAKEEEIVAQVDNAAVKATNESNSVNEITVVQPDDTKKITNGTGLFNKLFKRKDSAIPPSVKLVENTNNQNTTIADQSNSKNPSTGIFNNSDQTVKLPLAPVKEENNKATIETTSANNAQETTSEVQKTEVNNGETLTPVIQNVNTNKQELTSTTIVLTKDLQLNNDELNVEQDTKAQLIPSAEMSFTNLLAKQNSFSDEGQQKIDPEVQPDPGAITEYNGNGLTNKPRSQSQSSQ